MNDTCRMLFLKTLCQLSCTHCMDTNGDLVTRKEEASRWLNHTKEVFNVPT